MNKYDPLETRLANLKYMVSTFNDARGEGGQQRYADKVDVSAGYISQMLTKRRPFTEKSAIKHAGKLGLDSGWFSVPHPELWGGDVDIKSIHEDYILGDENTVEIDQYNDVAGSMGKGVVLSDQPGQITSVLVTPEWIEKNLPHNTGKNNIKIVTGFGDSMKPMFNPGDPIFVDAGVKDCNHDGVYFFRIGDEGFIKRLQRIPSQGIRAISENPAYEAWTITEDMDFEVFGKVLKVWAGTDF